MAGTFATLEEYLTWVDTPENIDEPLFAYDSAKESILKLDIRSDYDRIIVTWSESLRVYTINIGQIGYDVTTLYTTVAALLVDIGW